MSFPKIPNYSELREHKAGYDTRYEIDTEHPLHNDPLVDLRDEDFGFDDASSYYSKPNRMTGEVLPGVPNAPLARLDVALRLVRANNFLLLDKDVREVLGAPARLRVDDALRPLEVQKFAFEVAWPQIISKMNPEFTEDQVKAEVPSYCARPKDAVTPTPHLTGGAVDVCLVNADTNQPFDRGHKPGAVKGTTYPDFHEGYHIGGDSDIQNSPEQATVAALSTEVVLGRRVLHYAMTEVAGLYVNPQEIWHYGKGDPLSEYVAGTSRPYYGVAELPEWYLQEMNRLAADAAA